MAVDLEGVGRLLLDAGDRKRQDGTGDQLKQLRAFCQAAQFGSISRAAKQIMTSAPAVSTHIRNLERRLGVRLFERHGPRIVLTPFGEQIRDFAAPLVQGLDRLPDVFVEQHHGIVKDNLRIGAGQVSAAYLLPEYLKRFREQYPEVRIEVRTGTGEERLQWLRGYDLDIVVAAVDISPSDLEFHPLWASHATLITPLDHPLAERRTVPLEELAAYPFVGNASTSYARQAVENILRQHGFVPEVVIEVGDWDTVTKYVAAGMGISFIPDICLSRHEWVWRISYRGVIPQRNYGVIMRRDGLCSLMAHRFFQILAPEASATRAVR